MPNLYDIAYWAGVGVASPFWLIKKSAREKVLKAFDQRMGKIKQMRPDNHPAVMIHAVSLGEVNATQSLIKMLQTARPDVNLILSTTTETGYLQAMRLYPHGSGVTVIRYPLDFTSAIEHVLKQLRPTVVVLMELELWPNFMKQCEDRGIPVVLVNGRLTKPSYRKYLWAGPVVWKMFKRLSATCVQDEVYAARFKRLGAPNVQVTGTMKFDTAQVVDRVAGVNELAQELGLRTLADRIWICGSTGPGEEEIILKEYRKLIASPGFANLRLVLVPRHPDRFDEIAQAIEENKFSVVRRSRPANARADWVIPPVILGDTMGELKKFYAMGDVIFVGRSLVDLGPKQHGSDMIEAAALGKAVICGPFTGNFAEAVSKLKAADAMYEVNNGDALRNAVTELFNDRKKAQEMGARAKQVVEKEQGATMRHARVVLGFLPPPMSSTAREEES